MNSVHAHWLLGSSKPTLAVEEVAASTLASVRLRAGALSRCSRQLQVTFGREVPREASIIIVGKIGADDIEARSRQWLDLISEARTSGKTVILDYTDHHLGYPSVMGGFYSRAVALIDHVVVPSAAMARLLSRFFDRSIMVIPDAIEVPMVDPGHKTTDRHGLSIERKLLWFGHQSNLPYLLDWLRDLHLPGVSLQLKILTSDVGVSLLRNSTIASKTRVSCSAALWSIQTMLKSAMTSDLCVIPCGVSDPKKKGASSNRLLTALAMGLPTAADPLESYAEYAPYFTELRSRAFLDLVASPSSFHPLVRAAQKGPVAEHSLEKVGDKWRDFLLRF